MTTEAGTQISIHEPVVGLRVDYWPSTFIQGLITYTDPSRPLRAVITHVWHLRQVDLEVIDQEGKKFNAGSVPIIQPENIPPAPGTREYCVFRVSTNPELEESTADEALEVQIKAAGADRGARITPDDIKATIVSEFYFTGAEGVLGASAMGTAPAGRAKSLETLTFCILVLRNGFTVTGESACASPENFNAAIGRKVARLNAEEKVWQLEGYLLKQRLWGETA